MRVSGFWRFLFPPWRQPSRRWHLALLLLLLGPLPALAHAFPDTLVVRLPRLLANGKLMTRGWRYQVGDDPAWARPDFDASHWDTLTLGRPRRALPPAAQTGIYWLRWRFRLPDSLRQRSLCIQVSRLGATDVFLNGRRATAPADRARLLSNFLTPAPLEVPAGGPAEQVLAIRFAPGQPPRWLLGTDRIPLLWLHRLRSIAQQRQVEAERATAVTVTVGWAAVYLLLAGLHYAYSIYNPSQRANRYFARAMLAYCLSWLASVYLGSAGLPSWHWVPVYYGGTSLLALAGGWWALQTTAALVDAPRDRVRAGLLVVGALLQLLNFLTCLSPWADLPGWLFTALVFVQVLRLLGRALRQRQRGALLLASGYGVALASLLLVVVAVWLPLPWSNTALLLLFSVVVVMPPLSYSLYLAREFALGAELLLLKLGEVEQLSAQTLRQEQEKQLLLTQQNETLETQVAQRTGELQRSLLDLQTTQQQLIQKEKMASLGELTAGIAHEMQNPLNFVNNFADVSQELVAELEEAHAAGDRAEAAALAADVRDNLRKISQHGQRASGIVRGMLAHSRASTGERQPTNVNALCQEYLHLAYHGLQVKDQSFNAELQTDFASPLPLATAVAGDLGRVLLNLFTNAFYAVRQRQRTGEAGYVPTVCVQTRQLGQQVEIRVQDNGTGMSAEVKAKVFQPFFTTKPPGEGTGLGLSLSYDIVTQGHSGALTVESEPGHGSLFRVVLPSG